MLQYTIIFVYNYNLQLNYNYNYINRYKTDTKGTVRLRPQIAKANRGGRSNTQALVNQSTNHFNK